MFRTKLVVVMYVFSLLAAQQVLAQYPVIKAEDVKPLVTKQKAMLIDARLPEEYLAGHIPGAVNIPAERMIIEAARLPKDKTTPLIFYCRGAG